MTQACKDFGFFYLENHGVSEEAMAEVFRQSKAFFSLGIDDKLAVKADKNNRGFTPMHEEILDPAKQVKGDTKVPTAFSFGFLAPVRREYRVACSEDGLQ